MIGTELQDEKAAERQPPGHGGRPGRDLRRSRERQAGFQQRQPGRRWPTGCATRCTQAGVPLSEQQLQELVAGHADLPRHTAAFGPDHEFRSTCRPCPASMLLSLTLSSRSAIWRRSPFCRWRWSVRRSARTCATRPCWRHCTRWRGMLVYIAFRFEWIYGVAAVIAVFPRHHHHHRAVLAVQQRDFADRDRGAADAGRLFDERHDRDLRPHSRESEADAARAARNR